MFSIVQKTRSTHAYCILTCALFAYLLLEFFAFPFVKQSYSSLVLFDNGFISPVVERFMQGEDLYTEVAYPYGPLPVLLLSAFASVFGNSPQTLFWLTGILQLINMLLVLKLFMRTLNPILSLIGAVLIIFPPLFNIGISYTSYTPYEIFFLVALAIIWKPFHQRSLKHSLYIGIFLIFPYFCKFGSHLIAGLTILLIDIVCLRDKKDLKVFIKHQLMTALGFFSCLLILGVISFSYFPKQMAIEFLWPMFMVSQYKEVFGDDPFPKYHNLGFFIGVQAPILVSLICSILALLLVWGKKVKHIDWSLFIFPVFYIIAALTYLKNESYFYHYSWIAIMGLPLLRYIPKWIALPTILFLLPLTLNQSREIVGNVQISIKQTYEQVETPSGYSLQFTQEEKEGFMELKDALATIKTKGNYQDAQNSLFALDWSFGVAHYLNHSHASRHLFAIPYTIRPYEESEVTQQWIDHNFALVIQRQFFKNEDLSNNQALRKVLTNRLPINDLNKNLILSKVEDAIVLKQWVIYPLKVNQPQI